MLVFPNLLTDFDFKISIIAIIKPYIVKILNLYSTSK